MLTMPVIFRYDGFRIFFYANEGVPREPVHVHVLKNGSEAKFWMFPKVRVAANFGFDERTIRRLVKVVEERRTEIEFTWFEYFG